jgi:hypothetical protein
VRTTPQFPPDLPFGSYLVYPSPPQTTDAEQKAKSHVIGLKNDSAQSPDARYTLIGYTLRRLAQAVPGSVLSQLLNGELTLVPMPRRGILQKNSVWAPLTIAEVMVSLRLGADVMPIVRRTVASPKSAFADPARRPEPLDHYNSMAVDRPLLLPRRILLVDDVVTRGATFSGAAARLLEVDPHLEIHAFGVARAHTPFVTAVDPCLGSIVTDPNGLHCRRHDTPGV